MKVSNEKSKINLSQLSRKCRKPADKRSGRKKPRVLDCDIVPAPDSNAGLQLSKTVLSPKSEDPDDLLLPNSPRKSTKRVKFELDPPKNILEDCINEDTTETRTNWWIKSF